MCLFYFVILLFLFLYFSYLIHFVLVFILFHFVFVFILQWLRADIFFKILGCAHFILLFFILFLYFSYLIHFIFVFILFIILTIFIFCIFLISFVFFIYFFHSISFFEMKPNENHLADVWYSAWKKTWCPRPDIRMRRNSVLDYALQKITYFNHVTWKAIWSQDYLLLKNLSLGLRYFHVISNYKGHQKNYSLYTMTFT